ncbi:hypothetical protein CEN49_06515 [Fischerella thermalis CCMEE 5273]|nr:hypothetical protein CEN49_06515 [Fischerella thermalis CCMEE 5273]
MLVNSLKFYGLLAWLSIRLVLSFWLVATSISCEYQRFTIHRTTIPKILNSNSATRTNAIIFHSWISFSCSVVLAMFFCSDVYAWGVDAVPAATVSHTSSKTVGIYLQPLVYSLIPTDTEIDFKTYF